MNRRGGWYLAVFLTAVGLGGCSATSTTVRKVYELPGFEGGPFSQFLVVGITWDKYERERFEAAMVKALHDRDIRAVASLQVMGPGGSLSRDAVMRTAKETGSDAVLIARLKSVQARAEVVEGRSDLKVRHKEGNLVDFFRYEYETVNEPDSLKLVRTLVVSSDIYAARNGEKVWGVESTTFDEERMGELIGSKCSTIVMQLRRDGLAH